MAYQNCPKCGHAPLPTVQSLPAACPACGVILAKVGMPPVARRPGPPEGEDDDAAAQRPSAIAVLLHVPGQVDRARFWGRVALWLAFAAWGFSLMALDVRSGEINGSFIHRPLLIFHEAGHLVFRPLGEWMGVFGGSLGQLVMPAVLCGALLWKNRDPFGASIGLWLLGVSVMDVAPYIYDALQPQLMLLSGSTGEDSFHDWIYLLDSFGWRARAQGLGVAVHRVGALVMLVALAWGGWVLRLQHANVVDSLPGEAP